MKIAATAAFGLEAVTARELGKLGYAGLQVTNGRVTFEGEPGDICKANLNLRTADRVLVVLDSFTALTFDDLFEGIKRFPWEDWLSLGDQFPVSGKCINSKLMSVSDCQAISKKAIVERLKRKHNVSWFDETGPIYHIEVSIVKDVVEVTIDTSGAGLHKRGYRRLIGQAPLKETMAAALILISRWNRDRILVDPFCGSGTIPIEAAMIGMNIAPGLKRGFASEEWPQVPPSVWQKYRLEAEAGVMKDRELQISGYDIDKEAISLAMHSAKEAGVFEKILFKIQDIKELKSDLPYGFIICNPPYGERMGDIKQSQILYSELGRAYSGLNGWSCYALSANVEFERHFGKISDKKRKLYNGRIECNYYQYFGPPPRLSGWTAGQPHT